MDLLPLVLSVAGVGAIVFVCWLAGGTGKTVIRDAEAARAQLGYDEPTFRAARVLLASDRRTALLADDSGDDVAAVLVFGDKLVSRRFGRGAIRAVTLQQQPGAGSVLTVLTEDPTCRRIDVVLGAGAAEDASASSSDAAAERIGFWVSAMERLSNGSARPGAARTEEA